MKSPFLVGDRLYLRPLELEDAPALAAWLNDPEIARTLVYRGPISLRAEEDFIGKLNEDAITLALAVVLRQGDQLLGAAGLKDIDWCNRQAEFGLFLDKSEWGKGYGTEVTSLVVGHAFQTLNLNRVWLRVYAYNERGVRAYEKVGFRKEGVLRQDNFRDGRYWDTFVMAILREEWHPPQK